MHKHAAKQSTCCLNWGALALVAVCVSLTGCGSRQEQTASFAMPPLSVPDEEAKELSPKEMTALKTTGQIDRHIPDETMRAVTAQFKHFLDKGRPTMKVFSKRAENYLAYARKVFRSRGMPEDLAYLAIVESGYRSDAVSRAGAAGAWQFMPYTGMKYGLNQDWWMDERLDPYRATEAAADYLQKLYNDFKDWPTAIAAYNAGEGKMSRALQGTGTRTYYEVRTRNFMLNDKMQLREETLQYVPRFLAITKIMRNLPQLDFEPIYPEKTPLVLRFTARPGTDLLGLSRSCNMDWDDFSALNRHHKHPVTSTERTTFVYVPQRVEGKAVAFLQSSTSTMYAQWQPKKVQTSADSWEKISKRSGVSVAQLKAANMGKSAIYAGDTVLVPKQVSMTSSAVQRQSKERGSERNLPKGKQRTPVSSTLAQGGYHVLQPNETLYGIARKYDVSLAALQQANDIKDATSLRAGQKIRIPGNRTAVAEKNPSGRIGQRSSRGRSQRTTYTVKAGDSLWNIARRYDVSVADLKRWNNLDETAIRAGTTMIVESD